MVMYDNETMHPTHDYRERGTGKISQRYVFK